MKQHDAIEAEAVSYMLEAVNIADLVSIHLSYTFRLKP